MVKVKKAYPNLFRLLTKQLFRKAILSSPLMKQISVKMCTMLCINCPMDKVYLSRPIQGPML
jgi:hypothetical protein